MYIFQSSHKKEHAEYLKAIKEKEDESNKIPSLRPMTIPKSAVSKPITHVDKYPSDHALQQRFEEALVKMIVKDGLPFDSVEKEGFRDVISLLSPKLTVPCANTMKNKLSKLHHKVKIPNQLIPNQGWEFKHL